MQSSSSAPVLGQPQGHSFASVAERQGTSTCCRGTHTLPGFLRTDSPLTPGQFPSPHSDPFQLLLSLLPHPAVPQSSWTIFLGPNMLLLPHLRHPSVGLTLPFSCYPISLLLLTTTLVQTVSSVHFSPRTLSSFLQSLRHSLPLSLESLNRQCLASPMDLPAVTHLLLTLSSWVSRLPDPALCPQPPPDLSPCSLLPLGSKDSTSCLAQLCLQVREASKA